MISTAQRKSLQDRFCACVGEQYC